ncbi:hypothetical protein RND71_012500 [Anisodus tanguticus]|uniref:GRAM domain-containing protein n=1 Tax=Anisodus tanguticus TaxID=243964 RepID=A0AAE1VG18_9SOLA|nr:hypothetical protein RND71_012500 [Anisodus tanguticus]
MTISTLQPVALSLTLLFIEAAAEQNVYVVFSYFLVERIHKKRTVTICPRFHTNPNPNPNPKANPPSDHCHSSDYAPYPKLDPNDVTPVSVSGGPAPISSSDATTMPTESNPYVTPDPAQPPASLVKNKMDSVKDALGMWGKKAAEATKKAEDLTGNMWQHLKTSPSLADAAIGRIAQGTKVLAEGGYEKVFGQTFETLPEEKLLKSYACYLSTSAGPVMGVLYLSTAKIAFSSDNPLSYKVGDHTEYSYYKICLGYFSFAKLCLLACFAFNDLVLDLSPC